jgi:secondary thiamine-phosphate synthase enzyme
MNKEVIVPVNGQGLYDVTHKVAETVDSSGVRDGLATVFIRHTSASLIIQENADPSARRDLENWLDRLVPENDPLYTHTAEGPDDMPAHVKASLTAASVGIPIMDGRMALGTWQGVYLWEHRHHPGERRLIVSILGS